MDVDVGVPPEAVPKLKANKKHKIKVKTTSLTVVENGDRVQIFKLPNLDGATGVTPLPY